MYSVPILLVEEAKQKSRIRRHVSGPMLPVLGLVAIGAYLTNRVAEVLRSRQANLTQKRATIRQPSNADESEEAEPSNLVDSTGAIPQIVTRPDGVELYLRDFIVCAGVEARALVVLVHGWSWHSAYFQAFAEYLQNQGIVALTYDLRGHGKSGMVDGIRGYAKMQDHVEDLVAVLTYASEQHVGLPCFLFGESLGAAIAASAVAQRSTVAAVESLRGLLLAGPVFEVEPSLLPPPPVMWILRAASLLFPKLPLPNTADRSFDEAFGDSDAAEQARQDNLVVFEAPRLSSALSVISGVKQCHRDMPSVLLPWLLIHGDMDTRSSPKVSAKVYERSVCADKSLLLLKGARHQLFQDSPELTARAMGVFSSWILDHL